VLARIQNYNNPSSVAGKKIHNTNGLWQLAVLNEIDGNSYLLDTVRNKVLCNPPYLIIVEGRNAGVNCQIVIFSHQRIQDVKTGEFYQQGFSIPWAEGCSVSYCEKDICVNFPIPKCSIFGMI
jgi:hypothetical protein